MGSLTSKPLHLWSSDNVSAALASLGPKYIGYGAAAKENGVDGDLLVSMNERELSETMHDLGIQGRLHQRVVLKKLNDLKEMHQRRQGEEDGKRSVQIKQEEAVGFAASDSVSQDAQDEQKGGASRKRRRLDDEKDEEIPETDIRSKHQEVPTEKDLNVFDDIILKVLNKTSPSIAYAGIHLVRDEGLLVLSGSLRHEDKRLPMPRFLLHPHSVSLCSAFVRESQDHYLEKCLPPNKWGLEGSKSPNYSGFIVRDEKGNRVGSLCILDVADDVADGTSSSSVKKEALLKELAAETERLLQERQALLAREASLQTQIQSANPAHYENFGKSFSAFMSGDIETAEAKLGSSSLRTSLNTADSVETAQAPEPVKKVGLCSISRAPSSKRDAAQLREFEFDTASMPEFQLGRATQDETPHIPANLFDVCDKVGIVRPPVAKNDMQSIAAVEELNWKAITPETKIWQKLAKHISMTASTLDFPAAELVFHDHTRAYSICTYISNDRVREMIEGGYEIDNRYKDGTPCSWHVDRAESMCNWAIFKKKPFVVKDLAKDKTFAIAAEMAGVRAYIGCPLVDDADRAIANVCLYDFKPRPDFTKNCEFQLEQVGCIVLQELQNWSMRAKIENLEMERSKLLSNASSAKKAQPPDGEATIVLTDVEGSTRLWETNSDAMREALELHDQILRQQCSKHNGYEIDTEGDAFFLAFHDPVDAIAFALSTQLELYEAPWSDEILALEEAREESNSFRGLRVRMGIHHGPVTASPHEVTKRIEYSGPAWNLARSVERMSHGGQIVATLETWNLASSMGESAMGPCQVLDLGSHVLRKGKEWDEGVVSKSVVQLVPKSLSYDYFKIRRSSSVVNDKTEVNLAEDKPTLSGRQFPPILTKRQIAPSFHDAPFQDNNTTIMFISTSEVEKLLDDFQDTRSLLLRLIGELLIRHGCGYQCHCFMIAFSQPCDAIQFGFKYIQALVEHEAKSREDDVKLSKLIKMGCVHGEFSTMGPHATSGRAEYFGRVVNRAARVASAATPGSVCLGVSCKDSSPQLSSFGIGVTHVGPKEMKGVEEEITLYECHSSLCD